VFVVVLFVSLPTRFLKPKKHYVVMP